MDWHDVATEDLLDGALALAARGWAVVPLHGIVGGVCTCAQDCGKDAGKHPRMSGRYETYASTDPTVIAGWWRKWPGSNVGLVCGKQSGVWVLDVDPAGLEDLEDFELNAPGGALDAPRVKTGRGGYHYYFRWDPDDRVVTRIGARPGLDVKASGHVVAPPSAHILGTGYSWDRPLGGRLPRPSLALLKWMKQQEEWTSGGAAGPEGMPSIQEMLEKGLPEGQRDDGLFHAALKMLNAGMREDEVRKLVAQIAEQCQPPFPAAAAQKKVSSAVEHRARAQAGIPAWHPEASDGKVPEDQASAGGIETHGDSDDGTTGAGLAAWDGFGMMTDLGNALRLRSRWLDARPLVGGGWLVWDQETGRWNRGDRPLMEAAAELSSVLEQETALVNAGSADGVAKWRLASQSTGKVSAALALLETDPAAAVSEFDLDPDDWALLVANGVLDLRTGDLRTPERGDLFTRQANALWRGGDIEKAGGCPTFLASIHWATRHETQAVAREIEDALQMFFGAALTGVPFKNFLVLHGPGNSGKSSVIEGFAWALGSYAAVAPRGLLTRRSGAGGFGGGGEHATILTELEGRRFVYGVEPGAGEELAIELIKDVTSGGAMRARKMRMDYYEFPVKAKVLIDTNHPLRLRETSQALEERMISLGFLASVPQEDRKNRSWVLSRMRDESSGILAWAWQGLQRLLHASRAEGVGDLTELLGMSILAERAELVAEQDVCGRWLQDRVRQVVAGEDGAPVGEIGLTVKQVRESYQFWAAAEGITWMNVDHFIRELGAGLAAGRWMGGIRVRKQKRRWDKGAPSWGWPGIELVESSEYQP
jgi:P4 family phage/plasmid primase-like protien